LSLAAGSSLWPVASSRRNGNRTRALLGRPVPLDV